MTDEKAYSFYAIFYWYLPCCVLQYTRYTFDFKSFIELYIKSLKMFFHSLFEKPKFTKNEDFHLRSENGVLRVLYLPCAGYL